MGVAGKFASGQVGNFGEHNATQFEAPPSCPVELSGLQRIAHAFGPFADLHISMTDESANMFLRPGIRGWTKCGVSIFLRLAQAIRQANADQHQRAASDLIAG